MHANHYTHILRRHKHEGARTLKTLTRISSVNCETNSMPLRMLSNNYYAGKLFLKHLNVIIALFRSRIL